MSYLTNTINESQKLDRDLKKYLTDVVEDIKQVGVLNSDYDEYYSDYEDLDISDIDDARNRFSYHGMYYHSYSVNKGGESIHIVLKEDRYREPEYQDIDIPFSVFEKEYGWITWATEKLKAQLDIIVKRAARLKVKEVEDAKLQKQRDYENYLSLKAEFEGK